MRFENRYNDKIRLILIAVVHDELDKLKKARAAHNISKSLKLGC
jgi:hypothetical protein